MPGWSVQSISQSTKPLVILVQVHYNPDGSYDTSWGSAPFGFHKIYIHHPDQSSLLVASLYDEFFSAEEALTIARQLAPSEASFIHDVSFNPRPNRRSKRQT